MKRSTNPIAIAIIFLLGILLLAFYLTKGSSAKYKWHESYNTAGVQPYDLQYLHRVLRDSRSDTANFKTIDARLKEDLKITDKKCEAYVYVGGGFMLDTTDLNHLLKFVAQGNKAFISSESVPYDLMFYLDQQDECPDLYWKGYNYMRSDTIQVDMGHRKLTGPYSGFYKKKKSKVLSKNWYHFPLEYICPETEQFKPVGTIEFSDSSDSFCNMVEIKYGGGVFYLHTNPLLFTNYWFTKDLGYKYSKAALAYLNSTDVIYWDNFNRTPRLTGRGESDRPNLDHKGPLQYLLAQKSFAWAYATLAALALLYILFTAKRKQRWIPVKVPNKNTSLEFIETIGSLYFLQNNHRKLAGKKIKLFEAHIHSRFGIQPNERADFHQKFSERTLYPIADTKRLFNLINNIEREASITDDTLGKLHLALDNFYSNT